MPVCNYRFNIPSSWGVPGVPTTLEGDPCMPADALVIMLPQELAIVGDPRLGSCLLYGEQSVAVEWEGIIAEELGYIG